jgi:hypothetical protein
MVHCDAGAHESEDSWSRLVATAATPWTKRLESEKVSKREEGGEGGREGGREDFYFYIFTNIKIYQY